MTEPGPIILEFVRLAFDPAFESGSVLLFVVSHALLNQVCVIGHERSVRHAMHARWDIVVAARRFRIAPNLELAVHMPVTTAVLRFRIQNFARAKPDIPTLRGSDTTALTLGHYGAGHSPRVSRAA